MTVKAIINIGNLLSGDINNPILEANTIIIKDGIIKDIGAADLIDNYKVNETIDIQGATVAPGLIDSHTHPVLGDYTPRQTSSNYLEGFVHGGVTSIISAGEVHTPGRPDDPEGVKALALLTYKSFQKYRPKGIKVHAGALILEKGLVEEDFKQLADQGLWLIGEIGLGGIKEPDDAIPMVKWAKKHGFKVHMHTGGISIPGSSVVTAEMVMKVNPTVSSHTNGGPTAISIEEIDKLIDDTTMPLEIVQCGNMKVADHIVRRLNEKDQLDRLIIGTDSPSGSGVMPLGMYRTIAQLASLSNIPAEKLIACASGNSANVFGLNTAKIATGKEADIVVIDSPIGSSGKTAVQSLETGDLPAITMVMIDGDVQVKTSRNTPPSKRKPIFKKVNQVYNKV